MPENVSEIPNTNEAGDLTCPRCDTILEIKKAPFHLHDEYVGHFESWVCPICNYHLLTENGYDEAVTEAMKFGLVGPAEMTEVDNIVEEQLTYNPTISANNWEIKYIVKKSDEKYPITAYNKLFNIEIQQTSRHKQSKALLTTIQQI